MTSWRTGISWLDELRTTRPGAAERARRNAEWARIQAQMDAAARKLMRDIVKRRARAFLDDPGQLEMIAPGLSRLIPQAMLARLDELRRTSRSLRARPDPLVGRIDAYNLKAAKLAARLRRRAEPGEAATGCAARPHPDAAQRAPGSNTDAGGAPIRQVLKRLAPSTENGNRRRLTSCASTRPSAQPHCCAPRRAPHRGA